MFEQDTLIQGYLDYKLNVTRIAYGTMKDIKCSLKRVERAMGDIAADTVLWECKLSDFMEWIEVERNSVTSVTTLNKLITHARGFLEYAQRSGRTTRNVLDGFQLQHSFPKKEPISLTENEARLLIEACPLVKGQERRNRLVLLLLYGCGLRTLEFCSLDIGHVNVERQELNLMTTKGGKPRTVPIPTGVFTELLAYMHQRDAKRGALFITHHKRKRISVKEVSSIVRTAANLAGLTGHITPKALRHSYATHLMDRGVDISIISSLMGHRSPHETGVYLHVLPGKREAAVNLLVKEENE
jgi:integrase/recombinase XerD